MLFEDLRGTVKSTLNANRRKLRREDLEDIEQTAMIRLFNAWDKIKDCNNHVQMSYAAVTTKRLILDFERLWRRRVKEVYGRGWTVEYDGPWMIDEEVDPRPDVEAAVQIKDFFDSLSGDELRYWSMRAKGLSLREMADSTDRSWTTWQRVGKKVEKKWVLYLNSA